MKLDRKHIIIALILIIMLTSIAIKVWGYCKIKFHRHFFIEHSHLKKI